ncbi:MFS transporter [Clostridium magnum]|uniref:Inner membrane symporter YicJ n=1 Tax=Clostridium magnum DSM 2767 TaxID=1121326 RepID=A0A161W2E7_9CLOT|nr:glycoside-pentoside-hexuronide (GPH):cation symporter [Clostridium magnum]KZL89350.1 inner membrane symporter YicJ [Clostridium magnum DSM 2767]SHJ09917.1 glycoside/pentoside/hexuronide:cation symporter, GPH family [Clostridium magnum DSM 2767]
MSVTGTEKINLENTKLSRFQKIGYASGDFANNFSWSLVSAYLMYFWTDVALIPAILCGTFMLVSKLCDAVFDPVLGAIADRTKTKWGRYRPWILFACVPMLLLNIMCFTVLPSQSANARAFYCFACYLLLVLVYSCVNIPYSAMPATLTRDGDTRSSLSSYRMTGAFIATLILSQLVLRVVQWVGGGNEGKGFFWAAIIFSCVALPLYIFCFKTTKEVVEVPIEKVNYKGVLKVLKGNTPVMILVISFICWGFYEAAGGAVRMYYFKYYVGNDQLFIVNSGLMFLGRVIGTFSLSYLVTRVTNKRTLPMISFIICGILMIIMNYLPIHTAMGLNLYHGFTFLTGIGGGLGIASLFGMVPDTTEYTQYKYHQHAAGFVSAFITFAFKFGMAICTAIIGWVLGSLGYIANYGQNLNVMTAINVCMNLVCGIALLGSGVILYFYTIDKKTHVHMIEEINKIQ